MAEPLGSEDPLSTLRQHVRSAQQAAERLAEAATGETPPSGWASSDDGETAAELRALVDLVESLRAMLPDELREQLTEVIRQLLLLLRAIIDWLVARMERGETGRAVEVQDIPVV